MNKQITYVANHDPSWQIEAVYWSDVRESIAEHVPSWVVDLLVGQHHTGSRIQYNVAHGQYFLCHVYQMDEVLTEDSYICNSPVNVPHVRNKHEIDTRYHRYVEGVDPDV